jgi:2-keto-4-pentenoate hydratase/2-oxohepta-3-ene-1,7-dioic acid hydratase in catechol pathway
VKHQLHSMFVSSSRALLRASTILHALKPSPLTHLFKNVGPKFSTNVDTKSNSTINQIIRFQDESGEEYFGSYTDMTETKAYIATENENGKMQINSGEVRNVDVVLPPIDPPAIFCVGLNYIDHAKEVKLDIPQYPIIFMKSINTLVGHNNAVVIPEIAKDECDYEGELAVIIGKECLNVSEENALDYVLGYTIANDVSARRWQGKKGGGQWIRGKCFNTFLPLGPYITPRSAIANVQDLKIRTLVNGTVVQDGSTKDMIFSVAKLIEFISAGTTLFPGTVILTGTPAGVGYVKNKYLQSGDQVTIIIDGLGTLRSTVVQEI